MKKLIVIFLMMLITNISYSAVVTIDLEKLGPADAAAVLEKKKIAESPVPNIPEPSTVEKYAKMGTEIGSALKEVCKVLSVETNEFIKTPVGMGVAGLVLYHYFGKDLIKLILGLLFSFSLAVFNTISLYWWFSKKKVVVKQEGKMKEFKYIPRYDFNSADSRVGCGVIHVLVYCICIISALVTIINL